MDLEKIKSAFKKGDGIGVRKGGASRGAKGGKGVVNAKGGRAVKGAKAKGAGSGKYVSGRFKPAGARTQTAKRGQPGERATQGGKGGAKVVPVSPSKARLERRANDEKIIKIIKYTFTSIVTVAILGICLSIFLYAYKPTVATVGGMGISQYEFTYALNFMRLSSGSSGYTAAETMGQKALEHATKMKINQMVAKDRGLTITAEDKVQIKNQEDYINQLAANDTSTGTGPKKNGDEYIRGIFGIGMNNYKKIYQLELLGEKVSNQDLESIVVPDEDVEAKYDENAKDYVESDVRHILLMYEGKPDAAGVGEDAEGEGGDSEVSESEPAPARTTEESERLANEIADRIKAGEDMIALVHEYSEDNDLSNDGLYTQITPKTGFEQGFLDWTFAEGRQVGDVGVCETTYGYHVMKLENSRVIPLEEVKQDLIDEIKNAELEKITNDRLNDPKYQVQKNEKVYNSLISSVLGGA